MTDTEAPATDQNNESPRRGREIPYTAIGLIVAAVGYTVAHFVLDAQEPAGGYRLATDFNLLSGFLVVTLALERLVEPVRRLLGPDTDSKKTALVTASVAARVEPIPATASLAVAQKQADINRARRQTSIFTWGIATGAGFVVAALANTLFLHALAAPGPGASTLPPTWFDLLITGLIIGSGTKPTHDLVSRIEKSKNAAGDKAVRGAADTGSSG